VSSRTLAATGKLDSDALVDVLLQVHHVGFRPALLRCLRDEEKKQRERRQKEKR
jgi:hypothetical protein